MKETNNIENILTILNESYEKLVLEFEVIPDPGAINELETITSLTRDMGKIQGTLAIIDTTITTLLSLIEEEARKLSGDTNDEVNKLY
jgi:hypothetical protein